jgi:hypothetical protein
VGTKIVGWTKRIVGLILFAWAAVVVGSQLWEMHLRDGVRATDLGGIVLFSSIGLLGLAWALAKKRPPQS